MTYANHVKYSQSAFDDIKSVHVIVTHLVIKCYENSTVLKRFDQNHAKRVSVKELRKHNMLA